MAREADISAITDHPRVPVEGLTPREWEIAKLVARGCSNRKIAEELVIAASTVERHVANVLSKLNMHSRAQIAVWAADPNRAASPPSGAKPAVEWPSPVSFRPGYASSNLPAELSTFVGRKCELDELMALVPATRLLTLSGPGGIGKTRLAIRLARETLASFHGGTWLVRLDGLADPGLVPTAIASVLGIRERRQSLVETLAQVIDSRQILLVLDNCEHLIHACAELSGTLLEMCPRLHLLVTSREPLNTAGELTWRVPQMSLPYDAAETDAAALVRHDATRLFIERALTSNPDFILTDANAPAVTQVCRRLDGIPLAIELAATRLKVLTIEQVAQRLDNRFELLTGGSRTALHRQQTLRAAIDWSYDLLDEAERTVLDRLAVFAGGWWVEAAECIVSGGVVEQKHVLDLLSQLIDKSLVIAEVPRGQATRYRLLETIRQYAQERLADSGDSRSTRQRHALYYSEIAEYASRGLMGPGQGRWLESLELEHDNIRFALSYSLESADAELGVRLGAALWRFWRYRGHLAEAEAWLTRVLALTGGPPDRRVNATFGAGFVAMRRGKHVLARVLFERSRALATEIGDWHTVAGVLTQLGDMSRLEGDLTSARQYHLQGLAIRRERQADNQRDHRWGIAMSVAALAEVAVEEQTGTAARQLSEEAVALGREIGDEMILSVGLSCLGLVELAERNFGSAYAHFSESVMLSQRTGSVEGLLRGLRHLASLALACRQPERAVRLFGALAELSESFGFSGFGTVTNQIAEARSEVGDATFAYAWAAGRELSLALAMEEALECPIAGNLRDKLQ